MARSLNHHELAQAETEAMNPRKKGILARFPAITTSPCYPLQDPSTVSPSPHDAGAFTPSSYLYDTKRAR
jgi:hypothetical protein